MSNDIPADVIFPPAGKAAEKPQSQSDLPMAFGKFTLTKRIGRGGMAEAFLAQMEGSSGFTKTLVVKRMLSHLIDDEDFVKMFQREARLAALLTHTNVVQIYELGQIGAVQFIAMEYIDGVALHHLAAGAWRNGLTIPLEIICCAIADAALGLAAAHELCDDQGKKLGIVHRDISPDNLMVNREGVTKVLDFGVAKSSSGDGVEKTAAGMLKGKLAYLAPEQVLGRPIDGRTDIYALGVTFYGLVTGKRPFSGKGDVETMERIIQGGARPPWELNSALPQRVNDLILKMLAKEPDDRPADAGEVHDELAEALSSRRNIVVPFVRDFLANRLPSGDVGPGGMFCRAAPVGRAMKAWPVCEGVDDAIEEQVPTRVLQWTPGPDTPGSSASGDPVLLEAADVDPLPEVPEVVEATAPREPSQPVPVTTATPSLNSSLGSSITAATPVPMLASSVSPALSGALLQSMPTVPWQPAAPNLFDRPLSPAAVDDNVTSSVAPAVAPSVTGAELVLPSSAPFQASAVTDVVARSTPEAAWDEPTAAASAALARNDDGLATPAVFEAATFEPATFEPAAFEPAAFEPAAPGRGRTLLMAAAAVVVVVVVAAVVGFGGSDPPAEPDPNGVALATTVPTAVPQADPVVVVPPVETPPVETPPVEKPPVEKPLVEKPPVEKPPVEKPAETPASKKIDVQVKAPAGIQWQSAGKGVGAGTGTIKVALGTTSLVAVDKKRGGRSTVPVVNGVADYGALPRGKIHPRANPYADVSLGSEPLGTTPFAPVEVPIGTWSLRFTHNGKTETRSVDVTKGTVAKMSVSFE